MSSGDLKWQGIVLVPDHDSPTKNDQWGERQRRLTAIENEEGVYRRMDLKCVPVTIWGLVLTLW